MRSGDKLNLQCRHRMQRQRCTRMNLRNVLGKNVAFAKWGKMALVTVLTISNRMAETDLLTCPSV